MEIIFFIRRANFPLSLSAVSEKSRPSEKRGEPYTSLKAVPPLKMRYFPSGESNRPLSNTTSQNSLTTCITSIFKSLALFSAIVRSILINKIVNFCRMIHQSQDFVNSYLHICNKRPLSFTLNGLNDHSRETCPRRSQSGNGNPR